MSSWFKNLQPVFDPLGAVVRRHSKSTDRWYDGLRDTLHFWDSDRVMRGVRKQWSHNWDPLGNLLNRSFGSSHSASAVSSNINNSVYGHTGSIVGRY